MSGQKMDFYGYMDGYQEHRLRLGNMVLDYKNPDSRRSCIRQASDDSFENEKWRYTDPRSDCRVKISEHGEFGLFGAAEPFASMNFGQSAEHHAEIESNKMTRIEILSERLEEMVKEVKTSEPGHRWLHTHLSAAYTLSERGKRFFRQPRIWLLIGKYVADDAHYKKVRNQRWKAQAKGGAPTNPSGMTSVQGGLGKGGGGHVEVEWTMDGKRVWACKWLLLKCTIHKVPMTEAAAAVTEFDVHITDRYARGSVRSGEEALFARLDVASSETVDEVKDDMSKEDWITFDEVVKKAEIEYE